MSAYDIDFPLSSALQIILEIVGRSFFHWGAQNVNCCQKCESNRQKSLLNPWVWTLLLNISLHLPSQSTKKCLD